MAGAVYYLKIKEELGHEKRTKKKTLGFWGPFTVTLRES